MANAIGFDFCYLFQSVYMLFFFIGHPEQIRNATAEWDHNISLLILWGGD
jgi:hypothetical protein